MYRARTNMQITQVTQIKGAQPRNKVLYFDFVNEVTWSENWRDLTNNGKVIIPKNLYARDANNKPIPIKDLNAGGFSNDTPLLMRGDEVWIDYGYKYFKGGKEIFEGTYNQQKGTHLFSGYISQVTSKKPIEFKVEDNMWKLKQIMVPNHTFAATDTLEDALRFLLKDTSYTVNALTETTIGVFRVGSETMADVLARLRKYMRFNSYFKGNELRCGSTIYIESEAVEHTFTFQQNIISDDLQYNRKDDIVISILASNKTEEETGEIKKDGHAKTKCVRLEVLVTLQNGSDTPIWKVKQKGEELPPNMGGTREALPYPEAKSIADLVRLATADLRLRYYTGLKGKFTTFGIPYVKMGDNVQLIDKMLPERNGLYKVKGVEYSSGIGGIRQIIELDYKLNLTIK